MKYTFGSRCKRTCFAIQIVYLNFKYFAFFHSVFADNIQSKFFNTRFASLNFTQVVEDALIKVFDLKREEALQLV